MLSVGASSRIRSAGRSGGRDITLIMRLPVCPVSLKPRIKTRHTSIGTSIGAFRQSSER